MVEIAKACTTDGNLFSKLMGSQAPCEIQVLLGILVSMCKVEGRLNLIWPTIVL